MQLMSRMDKLEEKSAQQPGCRAKERSGMLPLWTDILLVGGVPVLGNQQIRETRIPWGDGPDPKGSHKGN